MKKLFIIAVMICSLVMVGSAFAGSNSNADANANAGAAIHDVNSSSGSNSSVGDVNSGSESSVGDVTPSASIDDHSTNVNKVYDRKFVNPGVTPLPQTNGFFTDPTPDSSYWDVRDILEILGNGKMIRISDGVVDNWADGGKSFGHYIIVNDDEFVPRAYDKDYKGRRNIYLTIERPDSMKITALVDGEATDGETNSIMVLGKAMQKALADGSNCLVIKAQNFHRFTRAEGWGIGFYTSGGATSESGKMSVSPGGGTGYAENESGTEDKPWFKGYAGVVPKNLKGYK